MLALEKSKSHRGRCTPNVLPCRINHNGAVNTSKRYWNPTVQPDRKTIAYFRGRKLHGKVLKVPAKYRGVVVERTERVLPKVEAPGQTQQGEQGEGEDDLEEEEEPEVKVMEEQAGFEEIVVWGHEVLPDGMADPYVRGMEDWIQFAENIHSFDREEPKKA
ncbi:hypothetical protein IFR04_002212 [Cadophora malorum]|uniref:Uncharacterized protein n=1 Tax=Cadophora malorum TaxID=108018 RepID=A0A8H7WGW2_9HELO|nr:hypothetical protein IFR04_002212 [Cadophora malorum]